MCDAPGVDYIGARSTRHSLRIRSEVALSKTVCLRSCIRDKNHRAQKQQSQNDCLYFTHSFSLLHSVLISACWARREFTPVRAPASWNSPRLTRIVMSDSPEGPVKLCTSVSKGGTYRRQATSGDFLHLSYLTVGLFSCSV